MKADLKRHLKHLVPLLALLAILAVAHASGVVGLMNWQNVHDHIDEIQLFAQQHFVCASMMYIGAYLVCSALPIPGDLLLPLLAGFFFPTGYAIVYTVVAGTCGSALLFLAARSAFSDLFRKRAGRFVRLVEKDFHKNAICYIVLMRLIPLIPSTVVNVVPALLRCRATTFLYATFVGLIPLSIVLSQAGQGLEEYFNNNAFPSFSAIFHPSVLLVLAALALLCLLPIFLRKWIKRER